MPIWPRFEPFWPLLVRMRRNSHKTTSGVKFDLRFEIYVRDFLYDETFFKIGPRFQLFLANFLLRMRRNDQNSNSGQILNPKLKPPWAVSYSTTNFGGTYSKIYACFKRKTAFVMQNLRNLGITGGWGDHFSPKPPKGTSLTNFTRFEPLCVQLRSGVLTLGEPTKKRNTTKSQRCYISPICGEFRTEPNVTKIGV